MSTSFTMLKIDTAITKLSEQVSHHEKISGADFANSLLVITKGLRDGLEAALKEIDQLKGRR
jgi:hypothetical protein